MSEPGKNIINDTILSSAQSGDNKQTEALIRQYRNVVEAIAAKYINSPLEYDDIIQEGMIGLLAAIKTFNNSKGAQFKTYAQTCINNSIQTALRKFNRKKDIVINLIMLAAALLLYFDISICRSTPGTIGKVLMVLFMMILVVYLMIFLYIYPVLAKFYNTIKNTFTNAFLMSIRGRYKTLHYEPFSK